MSVAIQLRRDTAANWTSANPILNQGELGVETDTGKIKIGDGATHWASLLYFDGGGGAVSSVAAADVSVVVSPTTGSVTVHTGTLDAIATARPPAASVPMNSHKFTGLANGSASSDSAAFGQIPTVDTTAGDFTASPGTAAAGSVGKVADAGHVHPQPALFAPTGLTGAVQASRYVGATSSGAPVSGAFSVGDWIIDKGTPAIWVCTGAGSPGTWSELSGGGGGGGITPPAGDLGGNTSVPTVVSTHLSAALPIAQGGTGQTTQQAAIDALTGSQSAGEYLRSNGTHATLQVIQANDLPTARWPWQFYCPIQGSGSDDAAPINAQRAAALSYALSNQGYAELLFGGGAYLMKAAPTVGGSFHGNAIIPLLPQAVASIKPVIKWKGVGDATSLLHWQQAVPQAAGTVFVCTRTDGTNDGTNGPAFVIGGPVGGYGGGTSLFSNELVVIDGITIQVPWNGTYGGFGFFGMAEANILNASCMAAGTVGGLGSFPDITNYGGITNQWPIGLQMPDVNNNDNANIGYYSTEGLFVGAQISEHTVFESIRAIYCLAAVQAGSWSGTPMPHGIQGKYLSGEACDSVLVGLGAQCKIDIAQVDLEDSGNAVFDPSNHLLGRIGLRSNSSVPPGYAAWTINGAANLEVEALDALGGPVASPHAPPSSGSPWANLYYRDAEITLSLSGGTLTALSIDAVDQHIPANCVLWKFSLPSGHSYTPTYTGTLSHDVTLR